MKLKNMSETEKDVIQVGTYVIVKKLNFKKIYKVSTSGTLQLGKDSVDMHEIIGKRFWTTFEMIPVKEGKHTYSLKEITEPESLNDLLNTLPSGSDNRTIFDDGTSQKLSKEEILQLQESGKSGKEIVGSLIENNKSFLDRTEYSQEKYLKKKEKKYLRYLTICKPSISSLHDVWFKKDQNKIMFLRMDTLAQLLLYSDVQSDGLYLLYDSGSLGLTAAAMLSRVGANTKGHIINLHPGNSNQALIMHAMNFPSEQYNRVLNVNIYSFLRLYYQGESTILNHISKRVVERNESKEVENNDGKHIPVIEEVNVEECLETAKESRETVDSNIIECNSLKRKLDESSESTKTVPAKKPKWFLQTKETVEMVQKTKARGLVVVAREHPFNIVSALLPFLGVSRPFIIYHRHREVLEETYIKLKKQQNVIHLRLFTNFLRSYQVLPNRTHPDISTSDSGGYLLSGYLVEQ